MTTTTTAELVAAKAEEVVNHYKTITDLRRTLAAAEEQYKILQTELAEAKRENSKTLTFKINEVSIQERSWRSGKREMDAKTLVSVWADTKTNTSDEFKHSVADDRAEIKARRVLAIEALDSLGIDRNAYTLSWNANRWGFVVNPTNVTHWLPQLRRVDLYVQFASEAN